MSPFNVVEILDKEEFREVDATSSEYDENTIKFP